MTDFISATGGLKSAAQLSAIAGHGPYISSSPTIVAVPPPLTGATLTRT